METRFGLLLLCGFAFACDRATPLPQSTALPPSAASAPGPVAGAPAAGVSTAAARPAMPIAAPAPPAAAATGAAGAAAPPSAGSGPPSDVMPAPTMGMPPPTSPGTKSGVDRGMPMPGDPNAFNPYAGFVSDIYDDDALWMCKPGLDRNYCLDDMVDAIEFLPDGSHVPFTDYAATTHAVDCLYWYPTVNRSEEPTSLDFSDPTPMVGALRNQAARLSRVCNMYAPFYRQFSLNAGGDEELGFRDVVDGFKHYIANLSEGRDFVIIGHSQGTSHAIRLIQQEIDPVPEMRARLVSALLIGGRAAVPVDAKVGGTFENIPLCERDDQVGCVVAFRSYTESMPPMMSRAPSGQISACTNPAALGGGKAIFKGAFFANQRSASLAIPQVTDIRAPWVLFRNFFQGECKRVGDGDQFLAISVADAPDDRREAFVDFGSVLGANLDLGLHVLDFSFPLDDLVDLVGKQVAAKVAGAKP